MKITDERYYAELLDQLDDILSVQQRDVIGIICARIRKIGAMNPTSVRQLLRANKAQAADLKAIKAAIAKGTKKSRQEIESIFEEAAKDNADFASATVEDAAGKLYTESIDQLAAAAARRFRNGVLNLSDTYAFKVDGVDRTIRETYIGAINKAAAAAYTGTMDYNTALRQYIKDMADSGLRVRSFETGKITSTGAGEKVVEWGDPEKPRKTERLDSAMRRAVIESVNVMHQETMKDIADSYPGVFDGYEISAHECPAPDHADIQGKQYTYAEYERMNSRLKRPIGTLGCGHMIFAVAVGKTPPTYSDEELKEMRDRAKKKIEVQGKEYTGYEARQKQREYERLIRKAKERELAFAAAGDDQQARRESEHIRDLYRGYADFSKKAGLRQELTRTGEKSLSYSAKDGSLTKASLRRVGRPEDSGKPTTNSIDNFKKNVIISGARIYDPESKKAEEFAKKYYGSIRSFKNDVQKIASNTGYAENDIREIKEYLFINKSLYDADIGEWRQFEPDCKIAHSWQRLMLGDNIKKHDMTLLKHEIYEMQLKKENPTISHEEAHERAQNIYNYRKESMEYYGSLKKYKKR